MSTATTKRPTEPICPPWCDGHDGKFQAWETMTAGGISRDHSHFSPVRGGNDLGVAVCRTEYEPGGLDLSEVLIFCGSDSASLTPAQARVFALRVLEAVELAEGETGAHA